MATAWIGPFAERAQLSTLPYHVTQIITVFSAYEGLTLFVSPPLLKALFPKRYAAFDHRTRINANIRVVSTIQAVFISTVALSVLLRSKTPSTNAFQRMWAYSQDIGRVQAFATGYFLWDLLVSVQHYRILGVGSLIHGITALTITLMGFRPFANHYGLRFVLYELSNPFLHLHWFLDKLGETGSTLQLVNGITLICTFFGCRIAWGFYQTACFFADAWTLWSTQRGAAFTDGVSSTNVAPIWLLGVYLVGNTILCGLNTYWFGLMLKALRKRFEKREEKRDE